MCTKVSVLKKPSWTFLSCSHTFYVSFYLQNVCSMYCGFFFCIYFLNVIALTFMFIIVLSNLTLLKVQQTYEHLNFIKLKYSWWYCFMCTTDWFDIFIDNTSFKVTIKDWLWSLCCTIYPYSFFILYIAVGAS